MVLSIKYYKPQNIMLLLTIKFVASGVFLEARYMCYSAVLSLQLAAVTDKVVVPSSSMASDTS